MLGPELVIAADGRIDGHAAHLEDMGKLRADGRDLRAEPAKEPLAELAERRVGRIGVVGELVVGKPRNRARGLP